MSTFAVTIETIATVRPIPDAERIELATLAGMDYQFVIGKGQYAPGARVLYFPVDSLLPLELAERIGVAGKLAGKDKDRVKTLRLRGQISQGLVTDLALLPPGLSDPAQITAALGVRKYEPPEILVADAVLTRLPEGQSRYDIESADRYVALAEALMDQPVFITEKLEGTNFWVRAEPDGTVTVGQREHSLQPKEGTEHLFFTLAARQRTGAFAAALARAHGQPALVYGEALGPRIQGNYYQLPTWTVRLFDLRIGGAWQAPQAFLDAVAAFYGDLTEVVPILQGPDGTTLRQWLQGRSVKEASNGRSMLVDRLREGIVIRPLTEGSAAIGRLVLKQRSPEYLAKSEL